MFDYSLVTEEPCDEANYNWYKSFSFYIVYMYVCVYVLILLLHIDRCRPLHGKLCEAPAAGYTSGIQQPLREPHHQWPALGFYTPRREADEAEGTCSSRDVVRLCAGMC